MLFVAGLAGDFDDVDLKEMFELYGEVSSARLITDRATGKSKGFGFVDMPNELEAKETIVTLDGVVLGRKKISVKEAEAQQNRGGGGGYNAGGGGGYNSGGNRDRGGYGNSGGGYGNSGGGYGNSSGGYGNSSSGGFNSNRPRTPRINNNRNNDNQDRGGFGGNR